MSLRGLLVLVAVLALLAIALVRLRGPEKKEDLAPPEAPVWAAFEESAARSIRIACDGASYVLTRTRPGTWSLTEPSAFEADPREVSTLLAALSKARARRTIAEAGADVGAFGLGADACAVRLELDGDAAGRALTLGRTSPVGYDRYARGTDGRVMLVDGSLHDALARPAEAYRERRLLPIDPASVSRLTIERPAGRVVLVRDAGEWRLDAPIRDRADRVEVESALRAAASLEVAPGAPAPRLPEAKAQRRIAISADGRTAFVAAAGVEGKRVGWREDGTTIGLVDEAALAELDRDPGAFRDRQVTSFSSSDVRRVEVTRGGGTLFLARGAEGEAWTASEDGGAAWPVEGGRVASLLDRLRSVRAREIVDGAAPSAATGTLVVSGENGELARATWGPLPPDAAEELVWVSTPARPGALFRVPASQFGPIPSRRAELTAP